MSSTLLSGLLFAGIAILIMAAYVSQILEKQRIKRVRIQAEHNDRVRKLEYMLTAFPPGYLSKELKLLLCGQIVHHLSELRQFNTASAKINTHIAAVESNMQAISHEVATEQSLSFPSQTQTIDIKELRALLKDLHGFVTRLYKHGAISKDTANIHVNHIRNLVLHITIDKFTVSGEMARKHGNHKLAMHHYTLAFNELAKQPNKNLYQKELIKYKTIIEQLKIEEAKALAGEQEAQGSPGVQAAQGTKEDAKAPQSSPGTLSNESEWNEFDKDSVFKKREYD